MKLDLTKTQKFAELYKELNEVIFPQLQQVNELESQRLSFNGRYLINSRCLTPYGYFIEFLNEEDIIGFRPFENQSTNKEQMIEILIKDGDDNNIGIYVPYCFFDDFESYKSGLIQELEENNAKEKALYDKFLKEQKTRFLESEKKNKEKRYELYLKLKEEFE